MIIMDIEIGDKVVLNDELIYANNFNLFNKSKTHARYHSIDAVPEDVPHVRKS